ncbi:MAG TPA: hypothetical protein VFU11_12795 [Solirubrobacterales bacterium]|nr:hypothetical protein [Solirubrobacterales bacterium]
MAKPESKSVAADERLKEALGEAAEIKFEPVAVSEPGTNLVRRS